MKRKNSIRITRGKIELLIFILCLMFLFGASVFAQENADNTAELITLNSVDNQYRSNHYPPSLRQDIMQDDDLYNGHGYNYYLGLYNDASKIRKAGRILIFTGLPASVVGLIIFGVGYGKAWGNDDGAVVYAGSGLFLFTAGFIALNVGIPMAISGSIKRKNNRKAMDAGWPNRNPEQVNLSFGTTRDGIGLIVKL